MVTTTDVLYNVEIAKTVGDAPASGFIDNVRPEAYGAAETPSVPATFAASEDKRRANWRYLNIIQQLGLMCNAHVLDLFAMDADANTPATTFYLTLQIERGAGALSTEDENNPGEFLTGSDAIKRCVARALCATSIHLTDVFDPTASTAIGNGGGGTTSAMRVGARIESLTVGALFSALADAEATVTVTVLA